MILGITGPVGAGKSTAIKIIQKHIQLNSGHVIHIDIDRLGHILLKQKKVVKEIVELFSASILIDGEINRARLANQVFENKKNYEKMTQIMYPLLKEAAESRVQKASNSALIVIDGAVLNEIGLLEITQSVWVILEEQNQNLESKSQFANRRKFQATRETYKSLSPHIFYNSYTKEFEQKIESWLIENNY